MCVINAHYVVGLAQFERCSGDDITQVGCSGVEKLSAIAGQSVEFNIALSHLDTVDNCFNQSIVMVSVHKIGSAIPVVECSNVSCSTSGNPRLSTTRSALNKFNITISLNNLSPRDSGNYSASADIRRPSDSMRVFIFKNFSLSVVDSTGKTAMKVTNATNNNAHVHLYCSL